MGASWAHGTQCCFPTWSGVWLEVPLSSISAPLAATSQLVWIATSHFLAKVRHCGTCNLRCDPPRIRPDQAASSSNTAKATFSRGQNLSQLAACNLLWYPTHIGMLQGMELCHPCLSVICGSQQLPQAAPNTLDIRSPSSAFTLFWGRVSLLKYITEKMVPLFEPLY